MVYNLEGAMKDLVVARYKEDLDWLNKIDLNVFRPIIYNKGLPLDIKFNHTNLANVGREAHTYLFHILKYYDNLPEYTIFVQGNPLDHCNDFFDAIKANYDGQIVLLGDTIIGEDIRGWYEWYEKVPSGSQITYLISVANKILGKETPPKAFFVTGAQFILHRDVIRHRSKEFYQNIFDMFSYDYLLPWHLERIWLYIWGYNNDCQIIKIGDNDQ
jgi:hypothetical protein